MKRDEVFWLIDAERERQEQLRASGKFEFTCADPMASDFQKLPVLGEEFGEVCKVVCERGTTRDLREELTQTAAVCVAWLESLPKPIQ